MSILQSTCPERKWRDHLDRANGLAECLPFWEWIALDGTPEGWMWWAEVLDGLNALVQLCDAWECSEPAPPASRHQDVQ